MGEATPVGLCGTITICISIHASRGGSDRSTRLPRRFSAAFQSTLPVGEATLRQHPHSHTYRYFNPRFPWGKRRPSSAMRPLIFDFNPRFPWGKRQPPNLGKNIIKKISIHASRGGSDWRYITIVRKSTLFQSTLPVGEATYRWVWINIEFYISIHASRGGSDAGSGL